MKFTLTSHIYKGNVYTVLAVRLFLILLALSLSRMSLYFFNAELFTGFSFTETLWAYFYGLRFDISILLMLTSLLILANALPMGFRRNYYYQRTINSISLLVVSVAIAFNLTDAIYYRFTLKRMTFDIFNYLESNGGFIELMPKFLVDFWYVNIGGIVLIVLLVLFYTKVRLNGKIEKTSWRFYSWHSMMFLVSTSLIVLGIRGGVQLKPINIVDAGLHVSARLTPLVLNTPFTIVKSYGQSGLQQKNDFHQKELEEIFNPLRSYSALDGAQDSIKNIVVIILESFSTEHIGYFTQKQTFTPFLDSLFEQSLVFSGIANGKRSIEGIPAILSSLPTLSNESFLNGPYAANQIEGLAATLGKHNYKTAFFHGGKNGTMSFDAYAYASGFDEYYGMNEYPDKDDFDGYWGIWDELYLKYFAEFISDFPEPFLATLFTLSSHHPYQVPNQYKNLLPTGVLEIQQSIAYTDLSLQKFFEIAKSKDWYQNTLFVITADHTSEGASPFYQNSLGQFSIPIAFYAPSDSMLKNRATTKIVQQLDIFPSVLNYLGINDSVLCFGNSIFDTSYQSFAINYYSHKVQIMDFNYLLKVQDSKATEFYLYKKDSLLNNNLVNDKNYNHLMMLQTAFIQQYNNRMISNSLKAKRYE